jgi:hypothetical protein
MEIAKSTNPLMVIIHITHHAGTFLCGLAKANKLRKPKFLCKLGEKKGKNDANWTKWKSMYDVVSWEYQRPPQKPLATANWESDQVISVLVIRDPLDRLLAHDAGARRKYGPLQKRTQEQWWEYSHDRMTNNFALKILSGGDTTETGLAKAKELVGRMTYVLDQACLNENLLQLTKELGWNNTANLGGGTVRRPTARERLGNDTLWEFLLERNENDIALYEWSKNRSLVVCDTLEKVPTLESKVNKLKSKAVEIAGTQPSVTLESGLEEMESADSLPQLSPPSSQWALLLFGFVLCFAVLVARVTRARIKAKKAAGASW